MIRKIINTLNNMPPIRHFIVRMQNFKQGTTKFKPGETLRFMVPLVEHCNLRCRGCDHFAPLAEQEFADVNAYAKDFARLSALFHGKVSGICLMGGEPLLHPQVKEFMSITRRPFPDAKIHLMSNGLLLLKQQADFWEACKHNHIVVNITKYPLRLDHNKMKDVAYSHGVILTLYGDKGRLGKTSYRIPLDLEGRQDARKNFKRCFHANYMIFLKKGRLSPCTVAPNIEHFNKYFQMAIPISPEDSIDIYKVQSAQEILEFLCQPIPFCKYCYVDKRTFGHPWKRSEKDIKEWTV